MQSDLFTCCVCSLDYNQTDRVPKILPQCGHTLCSSCLNSILHGKKLPRCPLDQTPFMDTIRNPFVTNIALLQVVEERMKRTRKLCKLHKEPKNYVCIEDRCKVCKVCAKQGHHYGHVVQHVNEVKAQAALRVKQLEQRIDSFELLRKTLGNLFEAGKKTLLLKLEEVLKRSKWLLTHRAEEVCSEISSFFDWKKLELNEKLEEDLATREKIIETIAVLSNGIINEKFIRTLEDNIEFNHIGAEVNELRTFINTFTGKIESMVDATDSPFAQMREELQILLFSQETAEPSPELELSSVGIPYSRAQKIISLLKIESLDGWLIISSSHDELSTSPIDSHLLTSEKLFKIGKVSLQFRKETISEETLEAIQEVWEHLGKVSYLKVDFANKFLSDKEVSSFCSLGCWASKSIESFELDLEECDVSDQSVTMIMKNVLSKMKNLKSLELRLGETNITDQSIVSFCEHVIPVLNGLENLNLDLYGTLLRDSSIQELFFALKDAIKSVKKFALSLSKTKATDKSLEKFTQYTLPSMKSLECFELYLCNVDVSDESVSPLFDGMKDVMSNIQALTLNLGNTKISHRSLESLGKFFCSEKMRLESVELFLYENEINDEEAERLLINIKERIRDLKIFELNLDSTHITDKTIKVLYENILSQGLTLKKLDISVDNTQVSQKAKNLVL